MNITILHVSLLPRRGTVFSPKGHIFRFHDRGSCYRRADIDKSGFTRFSGQNCSFGLPTVEDLKEEVRTNEHRFGGKKATLTGFPLFHSHREREPGRAALET